MRHKTPRCRQKAIPVAGGNYVLNFQPSKGKKKILINVAALLCAPKGNPVAWTYVTQRSIHINEQRTPFKGLFNIFPSAEVESVWKYCSLN